MPPTQKPPVRRRLPVAGLLGPHFYYDLIRLARKGWPTFARVFYLGILLVDAVEYLTKLADTDDGLGSLFDIGWFPRRGIFDIGTLVVGTLIVTSIAMLIAAAANPAGHMNIGQVSPTRKFSDFQKK